MDNLYVKHFLFLYFMLDDLLNILYKIHVNTIKVLKIKFLIYQQNILNILLNLLVKLVVQKLNYLNV